MDHQKNHTDQLRKFLSRMNREIDRALHAQDSGWGARWLWILRSQIWLFWQRLCDVRYAAWVAVICSSVALGLDIFAIAASMLVQDGLARGTRVHPFVPLHSYCIFNAVKN